MNVNLYAPNIIVVVPPIAPRTVGLRSIVPVRFILIRLFLVLTVTNSSLSIIMYLNNKLNIISILNSISIIIHSTYIVHNTWKSS